MTPTPRFCMTEGAPITIDEIRYSVILARRPIELKPEDIIGRDISLSRLSHGELDAAIRVVIGTNSINLYNRFLLENPCKKKIERAHQITDFVSRAIKYEYNSIYTQNTPTQNSNFKTEKHVIPSTEFIINLGKDVCVGQAAILCVMLELDKANFSQEIPRYSVMKLIGYADLDVSFHSVVKMKINNKDYVLDPANNTVILESNYERMPDDIREKINHVRKEEIPYKLLRPIEE